MSAPTKADSELNKLSSSPESEEDIPIDLMEEAVMTFGTALPPFIQKNLDSTIMPGDKHQVIPKTKNGTIPSIKSTKRVQIVCRAWNKINSDRFWTYDYRNVRYIVKAFRTHAQPRHLPKIAYHIWQGMGGQNRFQITQVAFDADDRLYGPDTKENFIPSGFGTIDTNKGLRTYADYLDHMLDGSKGSLTRRNSASNLRMKAFFSEFSFISDDDDGRPMRRTRSMKQKKSAYDHTEPPPIPALSFNAVTNTGVEGKSESTEPVKSQGRTKAGGSVGSRLVDEDKSDGKYNDKFSNDNFGGLRTRATQRRVVIQIEYSSDSDSNYQQKPTTLSKDLDSGYQHKPTTSNKDLDSGYQHKPTTLSEDLDSSHQHKPTTFNKDLDSSYHNKPKKVSQDLDNEKADDIGNRNPGYDVKSSKVLKSQIKSETDRVSNGKIQSITSGTKGPLYAKTSQRPTRSGRENCVPKRNLQSTQGRRED